MDRFLKISGHDAQRYIAAGVTFGSGGERGRCGGKRGERREAI
jgi:hypothetical protein